MLQELEVKSSTHQMVKWAVKNNIIEIRCGDGRYSKPAAMCTVRLIEMVITICDNEREDDSPISNMIFDAQKPRNDDESSSDLEKTSTARSVATKDGEINITNMNIIINAQKHRNDDQSSSDGPSTFRSIDSDESFWTKHLK